MPRKGRSGKDETDQEKKKMGALFEMLRGDKGGSFKDPETGLNRLVGSCCKKATSRKNLRWGL